MIWYAYSWKPSWMSFAVSGRFVVVEWLICCCLWCASKSRMLTMGWLVACNVCFLSFQEMMAAMETGLCGVQYWGLDKLLLNNHLRTTYLGILGVAKDVPKYQHPDYVLFCLLISTQNCCTSFSLIFPFFSPCFPPRPIVWCRKKIGIVMGYGFFWCLLSDVGKMMLFIIMNINFPFMPVV